ncbi:acyltransferase family protein [Aliarcobacter cryaerophilus]|uniref:Acyltransferase n=1 Tax=Aliarcobacter cryaerophilus TaxID=28198 RepID=A0A2S9TR97_9BACT|nr:acyltransferase [Aliarcobacter cryaerophilus]PRN01369.1 acyltransferase [Arcobacter cryaerophilus gv. pseudocryaerophilus]
MNNNFTLLRIFAALSVLIIHAVDHFDLKSNLVRVIHNFFTFFPGVPIFFIISGYLIPMSFDKLSLRNYFINRFLRIYPGLYVNLIISIIILFVFGQLNDISFIDFIAWLFAQTTFIQFYNLSDFRGFGVGVINGVVWTISVEVIFYIMVPFLSLFFIKNSNLKIFIISSLSLFIYYIITKNNPEIFIIKLLSVSILPYLWYFMAGWFFYRNKWMIKYIENKILIVGILYFLMNIINYDNFIIFVIKSIFMILFIFSFAYSFKTLSEKLTKNIDFTYGVYLYHMLIINLMIELSIKTDDLVMLFLVIIFSFIIGFLSFKYIEKPFLSLKKKS